MSVSLTGTASRASFEQLLRSITSAAASTMVPGSTPQTFTSEKAGGATQDGVY